MSERELKRYCYSIVTQIVHRQIRYNYGFGVTKRSNGEIVAGDTRDIVDTGEFLRGLVVEIDQDISVTAWFAGGDRTESILNQHPELSGIVMEEILEELSESIAYVAVKAKLENNSSGSVRVSF